MIGRVHASAKRFGPAVEALDASLRIRADHLPALSDRADVHAEQMQNAQAAADYERLLKLAPSNAIARVKLGMVYQRMKRLDDARAAYLAALQQNGSFAVAYNNLASMALERKQNVNESLPWASKAVELAPNVPQFHDTLGWAHRAAGNLPKAIASLETATKLPPPQPDIMFRLGQLYEEAGRKADAKAAYQRALAMASDFPQAGEAKARLTQLGK
jgi:Flp pilus assembly protein TadD